MSKKVVLVGHCGADSSYLRMAVKAARPDVQIESVEGDKELKAAIMNGADLVLFNRLVDYGFDTDQGVDLIRAYQRAFPTMKSMLVSNYDSAQGEAVQAGALPGFGKREIGTPRVKQLLQQVLTDASNEAETPGRVRT